MRLSDRPRRVVHRAIVPVALSVAVLALGACQHAPPPPSNATPERAVATNLRLTAAGDFDDLMKNRLPAADYAAWRAEWDKQHAHQEPATTEHEKQFADIMQMLTGPDAEAKLARRLEPQLAKIRGGKDEPMPIFGGILKAALKQMIVESPQLGPAQQTLANQGLDALAAWARTVDFGDAGKAKKAIALVVATARALHVQTLAQWRSLDYAASMRDYGVLWNGMERLLGLYGLDLAHSLSHARVDTLANDGSHATVRLRLSLAGRELAAQWPMLKLDDHWYDTALVDAWRKAHPAPAPGASAAAPAPPSSATAPPSAPTAPSAKPATTAATPAATRHAAPASAARHA